MDKYDENSKIFKALSDHNRLKIIDILSYGEKCAYQLLNYFDFKQPTLSHHMKILVECGLVEARKEGTWSHYRLNNKKANQSVLFYMSIINETDDCMCTETNSNK